MTINTRDLRTARPAGHRPAAQRAITGRRRSQITPVGAVGQVVLIIWALVILLPLLWTVLASFKTNSEIFGNSWTLPHALRLSSYARAWTKAHIGQYMFNSAIVVAFGTFGTMVLGSMAAYVLARYRFFGNRFIYYFFIAGLAFPVFLALVPLFFVVRNTGNLPVIGQF